MGNSQLQLLNLPIELERDEFCRDVIGNLAGTLQDVVGLYESEGFISIVGQKIGEGINRAYKDAFKVEQLDRAQVASVLVDLKRRIKGEFEVVFESDEKIVLQGNRCPFEEKVIGRPSLCMMTSNVFGVIASDNLGYAKVSIEKAIAQGDTACTVVVYLTEEGEGSLEEGVEYFRG